MERECKTCGKLFTVGKKTVFCSRQCKNNNSEAVVQWRQRLKLKAIEYMGGKCARCGYDKCPTALTFHHTEGKTFGIAHANCRAWSKVKQELDKCVCLCLNCHAEEHWHGSCSNMEQED